MDALPHPLLRYRQLVTLGTAERAASRDGETMARINITAIRRQQMVQAAVAVMAAKGWNETSIDEVTRAAGVSRGLVSYHFKDKTDLLSAVLASCRAAFNEAVSAASGVTDDEPERLRRVVRAALFQIRENPVNYQVFLHFAANAGSHPELGEQIRTLYSEYRAVITHGIAVGQHHGVYRAELDPVAAAAQIAAAIMGLALQWLTDPDAYPFEVAARQTEEMILAFLTGVPTSVPAPKADGHRQQIAT